VSSRRRHTRSKRDWSSDVCSSDLEDGYYSPIDQYQHNDKEPIGVELVFEHEQPVVGGRRWILSPDLVVALRLIKEGNNWVRPEEIGRASCREREEMEGVEGCNKGK